jgi:hypothetical protein
MRPEAGCCLISLAWSLFIRALRLSLVDQTQIMTIDRKHGRELMRACHTFRKSMTGRIAPAHSGLAAYSLAPETGQIAGASTIERSLRMALLRARSWGNEKNLFIFSTAALLMRDSTAASTVHRAADR